MKKVIKFFDWYFASGVIFGLSINYVLHGSLGHPFIAGIVLSGAICLAIYNSEAEKLEKQNGA
jgi:hypothetical protein